ncbi:MAG: hypothetical protein AAGM04_03200 [Pseudomonadota bacterium]
MASPWDIMSAQLRRGEELVWADRPRNKIAHMKKNKVTALFGVPFLAFAVFWTYTALTMTDDMRSGSAFNGDMFESVFGWIFPLFGMIFVFVGIGLVMSPLTAWATARNTIYGLSDQRLMIFNNGPKKTLRSWTYDDVNGIERTMESDGQTGALYFIEETSRHDGKTITTQIGFEGIENPQRVEETLLDLKEKAQN